MNKLLILFGVSAVTAAFAACQSDLSTPFAGGIDPKLLSEYPSFCKPDAQGVLPAGDTTDAKSSYNSGEQYGIGTISNCVQGDILTVWAKTMTSDFMIAKDDRTSGSITSDNRSSDLANHMIWEFLTSWEAKDFITVDWNVSYFHSILGGTLEKPEMIKIDYQKVYVNYDFAITHWAGAIVLQKVASDVTSVVVRSELGTAEGESKDPASALSAATGFIRILNQAVPNTDKLKQIQGSGPLP